MVNSFDYQLSTPYGIQKTARILKILKLMVTLTKSKVKSRSHHNVAHPQPLTIVPSKYQRPITRTRFYRSRSLRQGQRPNQGHTMTLHTYNPQPMPPPSINFLHLKVSEI